MAAGAPDGPIMARRTGTIGHDSMFRGDDSWRVV
jgi:hypothetical protein